MIDQKLRYLIMAPTIAIVLLVISGVALAHIPSYATSASNTVNPRPQQGAHWLPSYRIAIFQEISTINYWAYFDTESNVWNSYVLNSFIRTLFGYSPQHRNWIPVLAADFPSELTQEAEFWVSTVPLKQGVRWSDGNELTAEDVVFTANTVQEMGFGGNWSGSYGSAVFDHVEAVDTYTLKFFFTEKPGLGQWPFGVATTPVLPKHYWEPIVAQAKTQADPKDWLYHYVPQNEPTAGPFMLDEWVGGSHVTVVPNPHYYFHGLRVTEYANGAYQETLPGVYEFSAYGTPTGPVDLSYTVGPHMSSVRYELHTEASAVQALRDGDIDFVLHSSGLARDTWESLATEPNVTTVSNPADGFHYLAFNFRRSPTDVPAFRTAVATLIEREFPDTIVEENADPVWSVVPASNTYWHTSTTRIGHGLTRQERISETVDLLTTAGFTWTVQPDWDPVAQQVISGQGLHYGGSPVPALELLAPNNDYDPLRATAALSATQWLNEAGISVTAVLTDFGTIVNRAFGSHNFDMYILGWSLGSPYPGQLCSFFHSGADFNTPGYNNPAFDAKCDEFLSETDIEAARADAWELQTMLATDLPYITLFTPPVREAYRSDRVAFPYTQALDGIQGAGGMESVVRKPVALNINLGTDPPTLDPARATDTTSATVIEQLFSGLVDLDDETGEVTPELATSWEVSPGGTVYTFTLRSDATWTDGSPVTAQNVRYGILRTLDPATGSYAASPLFVIKNAKAYHTGDITDAGQVGVTALDDTHLRVTLEYPASYALSILALPVARPMPQGAIEAWGDAWTDPEHIVTNGAYRLREWIPDDHILLDKNPTFYHAGNVQIDRVNMWMVDAPAAWQMYLDGELDTAGVPADQLDTVRNDPILSQELHVAPIPCTYYYGFSVSQKPFDDPLVRRAFSAATDRQRLIDDVTGGVQRPALAFTPPGIFGHVDGHAENVGIPYDPTQAQQWLADAGYPGGAGLPEIELWFNESAGHQAIAEYLRDNWYTTLGVSVTLQSLPWSDYLDQLGDGQFQIWRLGWCADYNDAYNFLYDGVAARNAIHGGWTNATYDQLLSQAVEEQDPDLRKALYKQAEEVLVATDTVMIPLYYYASTVATKPYLERTYPAVGGFDIATWRIAHASGAIGPDGGSIISFDGNTTVEVPAGGFTDTVVISHRPAYSAPPAGSLRRIGDAFDMTAAYSDTGAPAQLAPGQTSTITVRYTDTELGPAMEHTLALYWWDGDSWSQAGITSSVDAVNGMVTAQLEQFSRFITAGLTCYSFDDNAQVDIGDVQTIAGRWRLFTGTPYDLDGDGVVTVGDIMNVAAHLGQPCSDAP